MPQEAALGGNAVTFDGLTGYGNGITSVCYKHEYQSQKIITFSITSSEFYNQQDRKETVHRLRKFEGSRKYVRPYSDWLEASHRMGSFM